MLQLLTSDYAYTLLDLIRHASSSIDILSYVSKFNMYKKSDKALLIFLALKSFTGNPRNIRIILDFPKSHKPNYAPNLFSTRRFKEANFNVRYLNSGSTQHAKLIIVDCKFAVFGSHNFTTKSVINAHDLSLLLDDQDLILYLINHFNRCWDNSLPA